MVDIFVLNTVFELLQKLLRCERNQVLNGWPLGRLNIAAEGVALGERLAVSSMARG
jgi:hypothetical protein